MEILGYFFAIIIGIVMGIIGGGGSILCVPVMAYLFKIDAITATALSLFVVGITSSVGSVEFMKQKAVNFRTALLFGFPSILGIIFSRRIIVPNLPENIINQWGILLTKEMFILIIFGLLMFFASIKMINKKQLEPLKTKENNYTLIVSQGLFVGLITGFVGAGGGFLIVPALVMLLRIPMKEAVGTSLFIISINSLIGFASSLDKVEINWNFLILFSSLSVLGILFGVQISKKIEAKKLRPIFGWFIMIMGLWIIANELLFKHI